MTETAPGAVWWRSFPSEAFPAGSDPLSGAAAHWLPLPSAPLREASSVADLGLWYAIGEAWAHTAMAVARTPAPRVLDLGCGCGKVARFFVAGDAASYLGIDVFKPAVEWCRRAFACFSRFSFVHMNIRSGLYNPAGTIPPEAATLPVGDGTIDLAICASLFTHLPEPAFRRYLAELRRCLSGAGRALISIHNQPPEGRFSGTETRIDIADAFFVELAQACRLAVVERVGTVFGQEVFVLAPVLAVAPTGPLPE